MASPYSFLKPASQLVGPRVVLLLLQPALRGTARRSAAGPRECVRLWTRRARCAELGRALLAAGCEAMEDY
jgi:hypothetical protein